MTARFLLSSLLVQHQPEAESWKYGENNHLLSCRHQEEGNPLHSQLLGQDHSHTTGQSHGQSQGTIQYDRTTSPQPVDKMMVRSEAQPSNKQNVHAVIQPMSQPVGGWHVTSMTGQPRLTMTNPMSQDHRTKQ